MVAQNFYIWYYGKMEIKKVSLKDYSSLRIGGEGEMVVVTSIMEWVEVYMYAKKAGKNVHVVGGGTNTYFGEDLSSFLFIKNEIKGISYEETDDTIFLTANAGEVWDIIVQFSVDKNLWGIENLSYIPGTVGAAPVQNIGAYGVELKDVFMSLSALDTTTLDIVEMDNEACEFSYRDSMFKKEYGRYVIISVTLKLMKTANPKLSYKPLDSLREVKDLTPHIVRELVIATRKAKLPDWKEHPNAGSFFKNPIVSLVQGKTLHKTYPNIPLIEVNDGYKIPAAWLIEHVALMKGVRSKDVGTWPSQPLAIVNYGDASADKLDIFTKEIKDKIFEKTGVLLNQEVNRIG